MTTNDRRKTFNTPLEFWQWAIMEPGKRKATTVQGDTIAILPLVDGRPRTYGVGPGHSEVSHVQCPLTAVKDEHGVIEEAIENRELVDWIAYVGGSEAEQRHAAIKPIMRIITTLIDERIAAATVQDGYNRIDGGTEWRDNRIMRLKPKGESK